MAEIHRIDFVDIIRRGFTLKFRADRDGGDDVFALDAAANLIGTHISAYGGDIEARVEVIDAKLEDDGRAMRVTLRGDS